MAVSKKRRLQCWRWEVSFKDETGETFLIGAYSVKQGWKLVYLSLYGLYGWTPQVIQVDKKKINQPPNAPKNRAFVMHKGKILKI